MLSQLLHKPLQISVRAALQLGSDALVHVLDHLRIANICERPHRFFLRRCYMVYGVRISISVFDIVHASESRFLVTVRLCTVFMFLSVFVGPHSKTADKSLLFVYRSSVYLYSVALELSVKEG